jgi:formylglycine-generating enzyme required for sulfatase activity
MPIAPGTFSLGSERGRNERPVTRVTLSQPFWLGKTEVRQKEWTALMSNNPSRFKGDNRPVEMVTWTEAMEFCRRLTERERAAGRLTDAYVFTLPTEAQWEYAARAGLTDNDVIAVDEMVWNDQNSGKVTRDVATKRANAWGLYDMLGNVWEWCADFYGRYPGGAVTDYAGVPSSSERIFRGGSWDDSPKDFRFAVRQAEKIGERTSILGLRVALVRVN